MAVSTESHQLRLERAMKNALTSVSQLLGMHDGVELTFNPGTKGWICTKTAPVVWFDRALLQACLANNRTSVPALAPLWSFDAQRIKLTAENGTWIWVLTGREDAEETGPDEAPRIRYEARWPD